MIAFRAIDRTFKKLASFSGIVTLFVILGCKEPIKTESGNTFLAKVMEASGGSEAYASIKSISFQKAFRLYREDGGVEIDRLEVHSYDFSNGTNRLIQWKSDNNMYNLVEKDTALFQTKNMVRDTAVSREVLQNKLNAATFVIGLPYTLANDGSTKSYNGIQRFEGSPAHELEVAFTGSTDIWKMYYSTDSLDWLGYWVKTSDHYSLVINEQMTEVNGLKFSQKRKSYRTDAQKNRLYLRADYDYANYQIK